MNEERDALIQKIKKKTPLWLDMVYLVCIVAGIWSATHLVLNYSAYSQIIEYKWDTFNNGRIDVAQNLQGNEFNTANVVVSEEDGVEVVVEKKERGNFSLVDKWIPQPEAELEMIDETLVAQFRDKELKPRNEAQKTFETMPIYPSDNRVYLPRIHKNVPLVSVPTNKNWNQLEQNIQSGLQNGVVVHPISHAPGNFGNFFLTGHSSYYAWDDGRYKDVFALLHEVQEGDLVEVFWEGKRYTYKMREKKVVAPTVVEVLKQPKDDKIITLMTCTPVGTNKNRLILVGDLKEG